MVRDTVLAVILAAALLTVTGLGATECINREYAPPCEGIDCDAPGWRLPTVGFDDDGATTISTGTVTANVGPDQVMRGLVIDGGEVKVDIGQEGVDHVMLVTDTGNRIKVARAGASNQCLPIAQSEGSNSNSIDLAKCRRAQGAPKSRLARRSQE